MSLLARSLPISSRDSSSVTVRTISLATSGLSFALSESYQNYCEDLKQLKERPDLYSQLNVFRRRNLQLQILSDAEDYDDKTEELQKEYKNILMESVVMDFLTSEQAVCKLLRKVYDVLYKEIDLDISYMDEE